MKRRQRALDTTFEYNLWLLWARVRVHVHSTWLAAIASWGNCPFPLVLALERKGSSKTKKEISVGSIQSKTQRSNAADTTPYSHYLHGVVPDLSAVPSARLVLQLCRHCSAKMEIDIMSLEFYYYYYFK